MPSDRKRRLVQVLASAVEALNEGRDRAVVERLREVWRETRDPQVAEVYELLVRAFRGPPLDGRDGAERAACWIERAQQNPGDPLELPVLIDEPWHADIGEDQRLRLLERWSPDPLLANAVARRLRIPQVAPHMPGAHALALASVALLGAQRDPRQAPTLEWLGEQPRLTASTRAQIRHTRTQLRALEIIALNPEERRAMATLARRAAIEGETASRSAELLAAVYADPDRDAPRLVYADWLSTHGDARGEFITLQIERARSGGPVTAREQALLTRHVHEWTGALRGVLGYETQEFERGFLSAASVEVAELDGEVVDAGEWSTLRILDGHVSDALARRGPLDQLRELYGFLQLERFIALRADNLLGAVETYECSLADPQLSLDTPLGLRTLLVRRALDDALIALTDSTAITRLEQLGVYYSQAPTSGADHRERLLARDRYELLRARLPIHVRRLQLLDGDSTRASRAKGWVLTFERDELEMLTHLRVDWRRASRGRRGESAVAQLVEILDGLGVGSLRRVTLGWFEDPSRGLAVARVRELVEGLGCEVVDREIYSGSTSG